MTREEAKEVLIIKAGYGDFVENIIDQIFNDHETSIEILMKANEEEISRHFNECEKYEAQLKAKDEEIERLEKYITNLEDGLRMIREARKLQGQQ